jgi:hypothetical protein
LDENTGTTSADATGNGHTGTFNNAPSWATGKINSGVDLGFALTQYIDVGNSSALNPTSAISLAGWFKLSHTPGGTASADSWLISRDDNSLGRSYAFGYSEQSTNEIILQINGGLGVSFSATCSLSTWYHIVVTGDVANGYTLYLNGSSVATAAWTAPASATGNTRIGGRTYSGFEGWLYGVVDEIGAWNVRLSPSNAVALYGSGSGLPFSSFT